MASSSVQEQARAFVDQFNADYEAKHESFERQFWGTKMALAGDEYSAENLSRTKKEMEDLLSDPEILEQASDFRSRIDDSCGGGDDETLAKTLDIIIRTCRCYDMSSSPDAKKLREETAQLESSLEIARNQMKLGYVEPNDDDEGTRFLEMSSVGLRNKLRTDADESVRRAAYDGLRAIGPFVLDHGFVEIVKLRNKMAKSLGFIDYYDYKVTNAEGFGKDRLFEMLDGLEKGTRRTMEKARQELAKRYGDDALEPWNTSYKMAGSIVAKLDPYFPFELAVERYVKSYTALRADYQQSTMNLDLLDRPNKYSNGFCHWPKPAWCKPDGTWQPAVANFTSLADPTAVGSGLTALTTLMHEAGHALHFANIKQCSPLFSQERAPSSVAYCENQSMFLDSLVDDAAWRARYARTKGGDEPVPFELIEEEIRAKQPFSVFQLRAMLAVSYFEKALYELPEDKVTAETIVELADEVEKDIQGGLSPRPLLSIPHLISDEASCYYHGYTLAEMSVHQTRTFFLERDGYIVDNPTVGPTLMSAYWECGNSRPFLDLVKELTGKELSGDAWIAVLEESVEDKIKRQKKEYDEALSAMATSDSASSDNVDLNMTVRFVDGDELIADSSSIAGGILGACKVFQTFVSARVAAKN